MAVTNATDLLNTTASPTESQESSLSVISLNIKRICPPILVVVGIIGNLLTLLILGKKKNRRSQSISFLLSLAVSDTLLILTGNLSEWIRIMWKIDIRSSNAVMCKVHVFLTYFSIHFSSWILVLFTVERTISVLAPHKVRMWCDRRKERKSIFVLAVILAGLNGHFLVGIVHKYNSYTMRYCAGSSESYINFLNDVYTKIDLCVAFVIPALIIIIGNTIIVVKLARRTKSHQQMVASAQAKHPLTAVLILLNVVFILSMGPSAMFLLFYANLIDKNLNIETATLIYNIVNVLAGLNASMNFILYILSGSKFRKEVKALLCCRDFKPRGAFLNTVRHSQSTSSGPFSSAVRNFESSFSGSAIANN